MVTAEIAGASMLLFIAIVLLFNAISLTSRAAQLRGVDTYALAFLNYLWASVICWCVVLISGSAMPTEAFRISLVAGIAYVSAFLFMLQSMKVKGTAIAQAVMGISVLVPIAAAMLLWGERLQLLSGVGVALALVSLPMLTLDKGYDRQPMTLSRFGALAGLFFANGLALVCTKWYHFADVQAHRALYPAALFAVAAVAGFILWKMRPERKLGKTEILWGAAVGIANAVTVLVLLAGLDAFQSAVLFPLTSAAALAVVTAFAAVVWHEIPGKIGWIGIGVASVAVVLANL